MTKRFKRGLEFPRVFIQINGGALIPVVVRFIIISENTPCKDGYFTYIRLFFNNGIDSIIAFVGILKEIPILFCFDVYKHTFCFLIKFVIFGQFEHGCFKETSFTFLGKERRAAEFLFTHLSEFFRFGGQHVIKRRYCRILGEVFFLCIFLEPFDLMYTLGIFGCKGFLRCDYKVKVLTGINGPFYGHHITGFVFGRRDGGSSSTYACAGCNQDQHY